MSNGINSVILLGYLGADPVVGQSGSGVVYAQFSLACKQSWKDGSGNRRQRTDWFRVVAFNGLATTLGRLQTGDQVAVSGRLQSKVYEDRQGVKRTVVEIVATTVEFLRLKDRPAAGEPEPAAADAGEPFGEGYGDDDDIPF
jgi:single-strand DNA-binding protein